MSEISEEAKLFLGSIDKKIDAGLLHRHSDMYLLGVYSVIQEASDEGMINKERHESERQDIKREVEYFKREVKQDG